MNAWPSSGVVLTYNRLWPIVSTPSMGSSGSGYLVESSLFYPTIHITLGGLPSFP